MTTSTPTEPLTVTRRNRAFGFNYSTDAQHTGIPSEPVPTPANQGMSAADVARELREARHSASGCFLATAVSFRGRRVVSVNGDTSNVAARIAELADQEDVSEYGEARRMQYIHDSLEIEVA